MYDRLHCRSWPNESFYQFRISKLSLGRHNAVNLRFLIMVNFILWIRVRRFFWLWSFLVLAFLAYVSVRSLFKSTAGVARAQKMIKYSPVREQSQSDPGLFRTESWRALNYVSWVTALNQGYSKCLFNTSRMPTFLRELTEQLRPMSKILVNNHSGQRNLIWMQQANIQINKGEGDIF